MFLCKKIRTMKIIASVVQCETELPLFRANRRSLQLHAHRDAASYSVRWVLSRMPSPLYYPGFRSPVRSSCARCRRLLGLRILRGNVTATRKPGLWNADARFSDGKYVHVPRIVLLCGVLLLSPTGYAARRLLQTAICSDMTK